MQNCGCSSLSYCCSYVLTMKEKRFFVYKGGLIHKASVDAEMLPKMFHAAEKDYSYDVQWSIP